MELVDYYSIWIGASFYSSTAAELVSCQTDSWTTVSGWGTAWTG